MILKFGKVLAPSILFFIKQLYLMTISKQTYMELATILFY